MSCMKPPLGYFSNLLVAFILVSFAKDQPLICKGEETSSAHAAEGIMIQVALKENHAESHRLWEDPWEPIIVTATLKGGRKETRIVRQIHDIGILVTDSEGKEVSRTAYGEHFLRNLAPQRTGVGSRAIVPMELNETLGWDINVSRQYDLSLPGTYFIQAQHLLIPEPHTENEVRNLVSEKLEITID